MIKALKKKIPILLMTLLLSAAFILTDSLADHKTILDASLDTGALLFTAVAGVVFFICFHKDFT